MFTSPSMITPASPSARSNPPDLSCWHGTRPLHQLAMSAYLYPNGYRLCYIQSNIVVANAHHAQWEEGMKQAARRHGVKGCHSPRCHEG